MSLLPCFIDESGRHEGASAFAIAGVIADQSKWSHLERSWKIALPECLPVYKFKKVRKWGRKGDRLNDKLADLLVEVEVRHLGVCLPTRDYDRSMVETGLSGRISSEMKYWHNPYTLGAMHLTMELCDESRRLATVNELPPGAGQCIKPMLCDVGAETHTFVKEIFPGLNRDGLLCEAEAASGSNYWELQVADFVCGLYRKAAESFPHDGQWESSSALQKIRPLTITARVWKFDTLEKLRQSVQPFIVSPSSTD